jgi:hypothetical protein
LMGHKPEVQTVPVTGFNLSILKVQAEISTSRVQGLVKRTRCIPGEYSVLLF